MLSFLSKRCWRDTGGRRGSPWEEEASHDFWCGLGRVNVQSWGYLVETALATAQSKAPLWPCSLSLAITFVYPSQYGSQIPTCLRELLWQVLVQFAYRFLCLRWSYHEQLFLLQVFPFPRHAPWALKAFCPCWHPYCMSVPQPILWKVTYCFPVLQTTSVIANQWTSLLPSSWATPLLMMFNLFYIWTFLVVLSYPRVPLQSLLIYYSYSFTIINNSLY